MDACGDAGRGFAATAEDDFQFTIVVEVGQDRSADERVVVGDCRKYDIAVSIEDINAPSGIAISSEDHDFEASVVVDVPDCSGILCHATHKGLCPKHIALSIDDVNFLVVAEDDFIGTVVVEVC